VRLLHSRHRLRDKFNAERHPRSQVDHILTSPKAVFSRLGMTWRRKFSAGRKSTGGTVPKKIPTGQTRRGGLLSGDSMENHAQQVLTPRGIDCHRDLNLHGDYLSDRARATGGGIGSLMAGGNIQITFPATLCSRTPTARAQNTRTRGDRRQPGSVL